MLKSVGGITTTKSNARRGAGSCPKITVDGMLPLCHACVGLVRLSLAHCGDCVTDDVLRAIGRHCNRLRLLDLTECDNFGEIGLKALVPTRADAPPPPAPMLGNGDGLQPPPSPQHSAAGTAESAASGSSSRRALFTGRGCKELRTLDLTGCARVSDLALLPFSDADFTAPGLQACDKSRRARASIEND